MTNDSCFESVRFYHLLLLLLQQLIIIIAIVFICEKKSEKVEGFMALGFGVLQHEVENLLQENQKEESQGLEILLQ
jgi:hypothetical protein